MLTSKIQTRALAGAVLLLLGPATAWAKGGTVGLSLDTSAGPRMLELQTFRAREDRLTAGFVPSRAWGPSVGVGAGVRLLAFTAAVRTSVSFFDGGDPQAEVDRYRLWNLDGDLGFVVPGWIVEPYALFGGGYSTLGGLDDAVAGLGRGLDVDGANLHAAVGADVRLHPMLVAGLRIEGHLLFLSREGITLRDLATPEEVGTIDEARRRVLEADGSSVGAGLGILANLGLRI